MKILIMDVVKPMLNDAGSVHRWELISNLAKLGQDVYVIAYKDVAFENVHVNKLRIEKGIFGKMFSKFRYIILLFRLTKKHNIDILYTRNGLTGLVGWIIKMITGSKLIYELNGILADEWETIRKEGKIGIFVRIKMVLSIHMEKFALKKSDAVITVTQRIKEILIKRGIDVSKVTVIPNGANVNLFRPVSDVIAVNKLRNKYSINENTRVVMFVGYLTYWQGVEYLIQSAPLVLKAVPDTMFFIVGEGELKNELITLAKKVGVLDKCIFTGKVPYEKVPLYVNMADVCVVPKRVLGFGYSPLKLYEYMACGKPVVATKTAGFEIVRQYNTGILVNPENPEEFSNAIVKLLLNEKLREQMGARGRKLIVSEYSWESAAKKTIEVFRTLLE